MEKAGRGVPSIDPLQNRLRQQKEDLLGLATDRAGEKTQDLISKVDTITQPIGQSFSTISHTKQAISNISDRVNSVRQKVQQLGGNPTAEANKTNLQPLPDDKPFVSPQRQAELQKNYPDPNEDPEIALNKGEINVVKSPAQVSEEVRQAGIRRSQYTMSQADSLNPFGGPGGGSLGGIDDDANVFKLTSSRNIFQSGLVRTPKLNVGGALTQPDSMSQRLGSMVNFSKPSVPNPHAGLGGDTSNLAGDVDSAVSKVSQTASKVGEAVDTGLGIAGDVMDALGPVGDLIGLGLSIFGGIEGHKAEEQKEDAQQQQLSAVKQPVSVNTSAPIGATLKTMGQQQVAQVHS